VLTDNTFSWYECRGKAFNILEHNDDHLTIELPADSKCPFGVVKFERKGKEARLGAGVNAYKTRVDYDHKRLSLYCWYSPSPR
jgi:hypothetical protein